MVTIEIDVVSDIVCAVGAHSIHIFNLLTKN